MSLQTALTAIGWFFILRAGFPKAPPAIIRGATFAGLVGAAKVKAAEEKAQRERRRAARGRARG